MPDTQSLQSVLLLDLKKDRIRIRKSTLHHIGDPDNIQLLVNPQSHAVAIIAVERETAGDQTQRIGRRLKDKSNYVDIISRSFLRRLCFITEGMNAGHSYHVSGIILPENRAAVYNLNTLRLTKEAGDAT